MQETKFGVDTDFRLAEPMDTWVPLASGYSARVFQGFLRDPEGTLREYAVKIMRPERRGISESQFANELKILLVLKDIPGITPAVESGFIKLADGQEVPPEIGPNETRRDPSLAKAHALNGQVRRAAEEQSAEFLAQLANPSQDGWLPYLVLPKRNFNRTGEINLLAHCSSHYTRGKLLPVDEGLNIAVQICGILASAHQKDVMHRDHKLVHYCWNKTHAQVYMIDWNNAIYEPGKPLTANQISQDLAELGARVLYRIFTGQAIDGALSEGATAPDALARAPGSYHVTWKEPELRRLPRELRQILERVLAGGYASAQELQEALINLQIILSIR